MKLSAREKSNRNARAINGFSSEQTLVAKIRELFDDSSSERWTWIAEFNSPNGIPDLVAIELSVNWQSKNAIATIPSRWLYALRSLPLKTPFTVDYFSNFSNVSATHAASVLRSFLLSGFCDFNRSAKKYTKLKNPEVVAKNIVAIEAKLHDWKRALHQASRYSDYAWQSWVVLDQVSLDRALPHLDHFERLGVGLAGLISNGSIEILNEAARRNPRSPHRYWHANGEIAKHLSHAFK